MTIDAMFCEHANENPSVCRCPANCYCKFNTCKDRGAQNMKPFEPQKHGFQVLDTFQLETEHNRETFGYLHGWVDSRSEPARHYILQLDPNATETKWKTVAACNSFESALAAGRLMSGAAKFGAEYERGLLHDDGRDRNA